MNIICLQENLKKTLDNALRIIKHNSTLPILNNFLLNTDKGGLKISSTDLELGFVSWVPSKVLKEGSITIPAQILSQFVNNLSNKNIDIKVVDQKIYLNCENIKASINGLSSEDFPIIPKVKSDFTLVLDSKILKESLGSVISSAALSSARPEISSIYLKVEPDQLKFVSTDSFRLSQKTLFLSSEKLKGRVKVNYEKSQNIIIPLRMANEIFRILSDKNTNITIIVDQNQILFNLGDTQLISRLIEGNYPDYEAIIPKSFETRCYLSRMDLEEAVKLSGCFSSRLNEVVLKTNCSQSCIDVLSNNNEIGSNESKISAKIEGKDVVITFNWRYLLDGLKSIDSEDVVIEFSGDQKPAILKPPKDSDFFYILMPIKNS